MNGYGEPPSPEDLERILLGSPRQVSRDDAVATAGLTLDEARRYWRALGFPEVHAGTMFSDADVEALRTVAGLVRLRTLDPETAVRLVRALGQTTARLAEWQVETLAEVVERLEATGIGTGSRLTTSYLVAQRLMPEFEQLLTYAWRMHLGAAARRIVAVGAVSRDPLLTTRASVGFADLVSYTRLSRSLTEDALATLVEGFETAASDIVSSAGARLVKTLGDEVLFVTADPIAAIEVACRMVEHIGGDEAMPDVRVGLATGPVLARLGDVFGTPVNLASRLTSLAERNTVLCDQESARALEGEGEFEARPMPPAEVRGLGPVVPYAVTRSRPLG